jgi:hypothetical protein
VISEFELKYDYAWLVTTMCPPIKISIRRVFFIVLFYPYRPALRKTCLSIYFL